eukprot:gene2024-2346_t
MLHLQAAAGPAPDPPPRDFELPLLDEKVIEAMRLAVRCTSRNPTVKSLKERILEGVDLLCEKKGLRPAEQSSDLRRPIKLPGEPAMTWGSGLRHIAEHQLPVIGVREFHTDKHLVRFSAVPVGWIRHSVGVSTVLELAKYATEKTDCTTTIQRRALGQDEEASDRAQQNG